MALLRYSRRAWNRDVPRETTTGDRMKPAFTRLPRLSFLMIALLATGLLGAATAQAELALSIGDGKMRLDNGVAKTVPGGQDMLAIIDLAPAKGGKIPKLVAEFAVPGSIVGPPQSVAISPDESFALVTANQKIDPADPGKTVPDNRMSVIDLKASPPAVIATVETGLGPAGVSISAKGNLALVANREEGTVSVFAISSKVLTSLGKIDLGNPKSGPSGVAISPDGKMALVTRDGDNRIAVLAIEQDKVEYIKKDLYAGYRPYGIHFSNTGNFAVLANIGMGQGDADTISLIDTQANPPRVVETVTAGQTPEGIALSPDSKYVAVTVMNGSNKPINSPFYNALGLVKLYKVVGHKLVYTSQVSSGVWTQGVAFSADSKTLLVQNKEQKELQVLKIVGDKLVDTKQRIGLTAGPAAIRTAR
jgi:DNA-binding beta-propeller fold protein YncE